MGLSERLGAGDLVQISFLQFQFLTVINYTKELLEPIVQRVFTYSDVCRELGLKPCSGNVKTVHRKIDDFNLDTSHFCRNKSSKSKVPVVQGRPLDEILVEDSTYVSTSSLKRRLVKEGVKENKCEICGITEWLGNPISLQLHHVNGVKTDNRIENLQILCPNCHSQTDNYGSKNIQ